MEPDGGIIRLDGETYFDGATGVNLPPQAHSLGYVFQDCALMAHMTVRGNIAFGARGLGKAEKTERS